jgi:2',3'-cyclic-nucleotide 2'-phosphodiesterase (5'-nucleotidase family)
MKYLGALFAVTLTLIAAACTPKQTQTAMVAVAETATEARVPAPTCPRLLDFVILQLNDVYEISPLDNGKVGGMARVATIKKEILKLNPNVITVLDGDYLNPSLIGALKCKFPSGNERVNGRHMVDVMNAIGVDYVTFGNHEFDLKENDLIARNQESKFQIISANVGHVVDKGIVRFAQGENPVPDYVVRRIDNGKGDTLRLGLLGVTLNANPQAYLNYTDQYVAGLDAYTRAQAESDVVMGITHLTISQDDTLAQRVPGMPLIMGGHEHQNMRHEVGGTRICKADANARTVYLHWCTYDFESKKLSIFSQLYPVTDAIVADPAVDAIVQKWESFADDCMESQGYMPNDTIGYAFVPLDGRDASMRTKQTNLGYLTCDAMKKCDALAQISLMNSGSVRLDDQITGVVTQRNILASLPFGGNIQHGKLKGSDLINVLNTGLDAKLFMNGAYLQFSSNLVRNGSGYVLDGKALDPNKEYMVALPGFLAAGGEPALSFIKGLTTWSDPDLKAATASGLKQNDIRDIVIWYMKQSPELKQILKMLH